MNFVEALFSSDGFMPHGYCYMWNPGLVWLHVVSDALIFLSYTSIPFTLLYFVRKRRDIPFSWMFLCFGAFIVSCGLTHAMEIWTLWHADYWLSGATKAVTAMASVPTAILLAKLVPDALAVPSPKALRQEIEERGRAEARVVTLHEELKVRAAQLEATNRHLESEIVMRRENERRLRDSQDSLRETSARLLHIQNEERRRIGRDLHDSAGQNLVMMKMNLDMLEAGASEVPGPALAECIRLVEETLREVRTTSYALYPPLLEDAGLNAAIKVYLDGFEERSGIAISLEGSLDSVRPPLDVELALFRVLQESLTNVLRHSQSPVAKIRLDASDGTVRLEVADQGKGIPPDVMEALNHGSTGSLGVGLRGMKERIRQLGGTLEILSTARGTTIRAVVACGPAA